MLKKLVTIKKSTIHGKGVFARQCISEGMKIGRFEGKLTGRDDKHVLWLTDDHDELYGIKGKNQLRYLNHSLVPNAEFTDSGELYAILNIDVNEEITIHYGEEWVDTP